MGFALFKLCLGVCYFESEIQTLPVTLFDGASVDVEEEDDLALMSRKHAIINFFTQSVPAFV
jgi:hypothetical protein